ncbi:MAG TPA: DUF4919 domain-containing protein [Chryseosolibacter sp.]
MKILHLTASLLLLPLLLNAQSLSYTEKAKAHYQKGEYREALYCFNHVLKKDSTNAEFFKLRGNCFFELNQLDSAERDYLRVVTLSDKFPEVYYNLGNISYENKNNAQAERYSRQFLTLKPNDADGLYQLYSLLKARHHDSAFFFLEKAYALDSTNQYFYNSLAWDLFEQKNYAKALTMAEASRKKHLLTNDLLPLEAYAAFSLGNFSHALKVADTLVIKFPDEIGFKLLQKKTQILNNTPADKIGQDGFTFTLTEYAQNRADLDTWVTTADHHYFYPKLIEKFRTHPEEMSLPEFFMVYYGYTTDKHYSPYGPAASALTKAARSEASAPAALELYKSAIAADPFDLQTYESIASIAMSLELKADFEQALTQYVGLMESILASGDGKTGKTAYFVISPRHEYHILDYLGLKSAMQALRHEDGHSFDVQTTMDESGEKNEIYFNIDKPWHSLSSILDKEKSSSKKKRKKEK